METTKHAPTEEKKIKTLEYARVKSHLVDLGITETLTMAMSQEQIEQALSALDFEINITVHDGTMIHIVGVFSKKGDFLHGFAFFSGQVKDFGITQYEQLKSELK